MEVISQVQSMQGRSAQEAAMFYAQAQSLVRFLLAQPESGRFLHFCRDLRDGVALEDALRKNFPKDFTSVEVFQEKWIDAFTQKRF